MILALDTATHTGWCLWSDTRVVESGVVSFEKRRGESNGSMFLRFRHWLDGMLKDNVKFVVYERAHHRGGAATEICTNLTGRVQECCAARSIEFAAVASVTLKKFATGSGRSDKAGVMMAASKLTGRSIEDDNEADAIMLAAYAASEYGNL